MSECVPCLHVCVTCRAGLPLPEGATPAGKYFYESVAALAGDGGAVRVLPVNCLASCDTGCAVAISAPGPGVDTEADLARVEALLAGGRR